MAKDPYWPSVLALLSMNGANNSQIFTEHKGRLVSVIGNAKISTDQFAPLSGNSSSAYFDGAGDELSISGSGGAFDFLDGAFTIELWLNLSAVNTRHRCLASYTGTYGWYIEVTPTNFLSFVSNTATIIATSGALQLGVWSHVAVCRRAGVFTLYKDGVALGSQGGVGTFGYGAPLQVGRAANVWSFLNGYIDDIRLTKGIARYTTNFTPPTEPYPTEGYVVGGTILDSNAQPVSRTLRVYDRVTGALVGSGVSSPVTGIYNIAINTANEVQVVMLDDALGTTENDQILRTTPV